MIALSSEVLLMQSKCSRGQLLPYTCVNTHNLAGAKERGITPYSPCRQFAETHDPEQTAWKDRSKAEDKEGTTCHELRGRYDPILHMRKARPIWKMRRGAKASTASKEGATHCEAWKARPARKGIEGANSSLSEG